VFAASGLAEEEPKHGGTLTYMIPRRAEEHCEHC
jgi:hypothetical protein